MMKGFYKLLEDYVLIHLPKECGYPLTTVTSYYTSIEQFVRWLEERRGIRMKAVTIHHFSRDHVQEFLQYLEEFLYMIPAEMMNGHSFHTDSTPFFQPADKLLDGGVIRGDCRQRIATLFREMNQYVIFK